MNDLFCSVNGATHARHYLHGLFQAPKHAKNMERMEEVVAGADYEGLQNFMADSPWEAQPVMDRVALDVSALLDGPGLLAYVDESSFSKKGDRSVGVARQYNGRLGKVDNCQVAVFIALGRGDRASLVGARLYLSEQWCADPERCKRAGIPPEAQLFKTKATLARELISHLRTHGAGFEASVLDGGYGKDPALLRGLDDDNEVFVADVHCSQRIWTDDPWPCLPPRPIPRRGPEARTLRAASASVTVSDWAAARPESEWVTVSLRRGTKGEIRVQYLHRRVYLWDGVEGTARLWHLIARRTLDKNGQPDAIAYTLSNAGADTPGSSVVAMACARFFIERSFQDAKSTLGLADYQTRSWRGWHHHIALVMMAMLFQLRERMIHVDSDPLLSTADIARLLSYFLPQAACTAEAILEQMHRRHRKRQSSIDSAYRRQYPLEEPAENLK